MKDNNTTNNNNADDESSESSPLILFYRDGRINNRHGVTLNEIWRYNYEQMESGHDWIQWVFPTADRASIFQNTLSDETVLKVFREDSKIQKNLRQSLDFYLEFLGLKLVVIVVVENEQLLLECKQRSNFKRRFKNWGRIHNCLEGINHNWRRISRMLICLKLCGMDAEADAILQRLKKIYVSGQLGDGKQQYNAMRIWIESAGKTEAVPCIKPNRGGCTIQ